MFSLSTDWWEIIVRVLIIYGVLLTLMRLSGKREIGQLGPMDFLTMLVLSETVSPGLTANDTSITAAMIASTTLFVLTVSVAVATYRSRRIERLAEGLPSTLITDGVLDHRVMRDERITHQELETALRKQGIHSMSDVMLGTVEPDGVISFVRRDGAA